VASGITLYKDNISDVLPTSLHNYWNQDNVSVTYVPTEGSTVILSDESNSGWYIDTPTENTKGETQQTLRWSNDFSLYLDGTVYIYVRLTFPENTKSTNAWTEYARSFGDAVLHNTWKVYQLESTVTHTLAVQAEAILEKGVYATGTATRTITGSDNKMEYAINTNEDSRWFYTNDTSANGIVTYYIALYNSGSTKLYINDIQDVLPEGFTFFSLYGNYGYSSSTYTLDKYVCDTATRKTSARNYMYYNRLLSLGDGVTYKSAQINATVSADKSLVTFTLGTSSYGPSISYDNSRGKYYLDPNEAVVIAYSCKTNGYNADVDEVTNQAAMRYDDYNGAGVTLTQDVEVEMGVRSELAANNGTASLTTTDQVRNWGMNVADATVQTQWLTSAVTIEKGNIIPGIQKKCDASSTPYVTDAVAWTITASNAGNDNLQDYTLTDVMMAPYEFTGDVTYQLYNANGTSIGNDVTLLCFTDGEGNDSRSNQDSQVTITYGTKQATLTVNGPAVEIDNSSLGKLEVSLSRDASTGNEQLSIRFMDASAALSPGGQGKLKLSTINYTTAALSKSYTNECYITPMEQEFDSSLVTQGNAVNFDIPQGDSEMPSVHCEAMTAVSYGYSSSAEKTVTELKEDLTATDNQTSSQSGTNYIVLSRDKDSVFRYALSMNNTGGRNGSMDVLRYVLVDNLPQPGDHTTLNTAYARYSEFQVDFASADQLQFEVAVTKDGVKSILDDSQYCLQFSMQTDFNYDGVSNAVWDGDALTSADGWYTLEECVAAGTLGDMRSLRVVIDDEAHTGLMPAESTITVSFNAVVDADSNPDYSAVAWNSFGYRYTVENGSMQAAPLKVGVKLKGIPHLQKSLLNEKGTAYTATKDETFRFLIYQSKNQNFASDATEAEKLEQLAQAGIPFAIATVTVKAGTTASQQTALENQKIWTYDSATKQLTEGTASWNWTESQVYTATELQDDGTGDFYLNSMNGKHSDSYTFTYHEATSVNIHGVNQLKSWNLLVNETAASGQQNLENAVFGLYSKEQPKTAVVITDSIQQMLKETIPSTYVDADGTVWYLIAVQATESNGQTEYEKLTEKMYLLRELQAPSGYQIDNAEGQLIQAPDTGTGTLKVTVVDSRVLIAGTGVQQTTTGLVAFALLMGTSVLWMRRKFTKFR
jgi:hypothetical protein